MNPNPRFSRLPVPALCAALALLSACDGGSTPATTTAPSPAPTPPATSTPPPPPEQLAAAATEAATTLTADATTWSPEALEDLLSPVALYPDVVLGQVLVASTNPQEVLDAGNWLIANPNLTGKAQDEAAEKVGFTVPMRAVMQFPDVVDKLCMNMNWTEELGQAYVNDQQGVMDAVQRLRKQAEDAGNLKSSEQMKVETKKEAGQPEVITVSPPSPQVVYVPQYDPQAVYATAPAGAVAVAPVTTTTTTTTTTEDKDEGHSTGSLVATGLLAFGAGMLVNEVFDDDDDYYHGGYYGPSMYYRPMPYYPPYPYRPAYGPGFYPGSAYNRPNNYIHGGNTVVINQNNNYYNRYNSPQRAAQTRNQPRSPITAAKPNRPELQQLNSKAAQGPARRAPASSEAWKGKGAYAGNDPAVRKSLDQQASKAQRAQDTRSRSAAQGNYAGAADRPGAGGTGTRATPTVGGKAPAPKVQGSYAGAKPDRPASAASRPAATAQNRDVTRPASTPNRDAARPTADRGHTANLGGATQAASRPAVENRPANAGNSALSRSSGSGAATRAASSRGQHSMPSGARSHGGRKR